jgi:predicted RNA-binding Zn ribbon-like protein
MGTEAQIERQRPRSFELIAGDVSLDFVNTLDNRPTDHEKELLGSYADLIAFARQSGYFDSRTASRLIEAAGEHPVKAKESLEKARELREAIHDAFAAVIEKRKAGAKALSVLNSFVREASTEQQLIESSGGFEWRTDYLLSLDSPVWPIARAAADLLTSDRLQFVRACSAPECRWFFLDTSKNHRRRWCDMKLCGNRAKVSSFYARQKEAAD